MINDGLNRIEPIVYGFNGESLALNTDIEKRKATERMEVIGRAFMAKENTLELLQEIDNKIFFLDQMQVQGYHSGVTLNESTIKVRFL